jgi:hypothetical protein
MASAACLCSWQNKTPTRPDSGLQFSANPQTFCPVTKSMLGEPVKVRSSQTAKLAIFFSEED